MKDILLHLFLPHESNNHRAKFLHHSTLVLLIAILFITHFFINYSSREYSQVLGVTSNITVTELLELTNQEREAQGLKPLKLSDQLSQAAHSKASNMFTQNYWAHNSPDGTTPWVFVRSSGYDYLYAGENLARGFTTSSDVVEAWMASPGHKENLLSGNYEDIGFAVVDGNLTGDDTILVVQIFGKAKQVSPPTEIASGESQSEKGIVFASDLSGEPQTAPRQINVASIQSQPLIDVQIFSKTSSVLLLTILVGLLLLDLILIQRRRVVRILSHNLDHIIFFSIVLLVIIIVGGGAVL